MNTIYPLAPVIDAYRGGDKEHKVIHPIQKEGERESKKSLERKLKEYYVPEVDFPKI